MPKKPEKPNKTALLRVHITLPADLMERVKDAANKDDQTLARKMQRLIERGLAA